MTVGCVNPAQPGATGLGAARQLLVYALEPAGAGRADQLVERGSAINPVRRTKGLVSAKCISDGPRGYLSIRTNHEPGEKWTDRIGGEVGIMGMFLPGWGMHLSDMQEARAIWCARSGRSAASDWRRPRYALSRRLRRPEHASRSASISKTPTPTASSITPII